MLLTIDIDEYLFKLKEKNYTWLLLQSSYIYRYNAVLMGGINIFITIYRRTCMIRIINIKKNT
jgi:hypothetical protein